MRGKNFCIFIAERRLNYFHVENHPILRKKGDIFVNCAVIITVVSQENSLIIVAFDIL